MICENSERSEWKIVKLLDVLEFIVDNRGKTVPTATLGIPLIATNCIKNDSLFPVFEKIRYVSEEIYSSWFRSHPKPGDIIFVNKGTPGRVCLVPNPVDFCIAQDMVALRADDKQIYPKYLFAVLRSPFIQQQIENMHVGTMIPHFKKGDFEKLSIPIPRREIQQFIGDCYFSLSMKIELNNRINKTLEEIAQAIFKQWFVDFDFPDENGQPYKSAGGEMEESELGLIPKGWKVGTVSDLGDIVGGGTPSKKEESYYASLGIPWITPKDLSDNRNKYISRGSLDISELGYKNSSAKKMPKGTVLFSSRAPIGYVAIAKNEITTNQGFKSIIPYSHVGSEFVYYFLKWSTDLIESRASGSTFKEISGGEMKKIPAIIPKIKILAHFNDIVGKMGKQMEKCEEENKIMINIRDSLLPKLMSGEIRVPVEEVQ